MAHLTTYLDIESRKILRSGFDFTLNLTSAIGDLANRGFLASYVSRHTAMAYDRVKLLIKCNSLVLFIESFPAIPNMP